MCISMHANIHIHAGETVQENAKSKGKGKSSKAGWMFGSPKRGFDFHSVSVYSSIYLLIYICTYYHVALPFISVATVRQIMHTHAWVGRRLCAPSLALSLVELTWPRFYVSCFQVLSRFGFSSYSFFELLGYGRDM